MRACPDMPTSGFLLRHASGVTFRDCGVTWGPNPPDYFRYALDAVACPGLDDPGSPAHAAHAGNAAQIDPMNL